MAIALAACTSQVRVLALTIIRVAARRGFAITFTQPLKEGIEANLDLDTPSLSLRSHTYHYHASYGSEPVDELELEIVDWTLSEDRRRWTCQVAPLREGYVHTFDFMGWTSESGQPLTHPSAAYTLNRIPKSK